MRQAARRGTAHALSPCGTPKEHIFDAGFGPGPTISASNETQLMLDSASGGLVDILPDEHSSFLPPATPGGDYIFFEAARVGKTGAVVLHTSDLATFALDNACASPVLSSPLPFNQCGGANDPGDLEFDENYTAPGSVLQDPTLPDGNLIMIYEGENHCRDGHNVQPYYATAGFARSSDNGATWPAPWWRSHRGWRAIRFSAVRTQSSLTTAIRPHPERIHRWQLPVRGVCGASGTGRRGWTYSRPNRTHAAGLSGAPAIPEISGRQRRRCIRLARTGWRGLQRDPLHRRRYAFGRADLHRHAVPTRTELQQHVASLPIDAGVPCFRRAWAARLVLVDATSLDLEDWGAARLIENTQATATTPCPNNTSGAYFDGWYPSFYSPGLAAGHTGSSGIAFYLSGCNLSTDRSFYSRQIAVTPDAG